MVRSFATIESPPWRYAVVLAALHQRTWSRWSREPKEDAHQRASFTIVPGSIETPLWRISKWRCGADDRPVSPLRPMTSPASHRRPLHREDAREVTVHGLVSVRMLDQNEAAVCLVLTGLEDDPPPGGAHQAPYWHSNVDAGMVVLGAVGERLSLRDIAPLVQGPVSGREGSVS